MYAHAHTHAHTHTYTRTHTHTDDLTQLLLKLEQPGDVDGKCRIASQLLEQLEAGDYRTNQVGTSCPSGLLGLWIGDEILAFIALRRKVPNTACAPSLQYLIL